MITASIATRNSEKTIKKCIRCIINAFPTKELNQIVVVDNCSTDDTVKIVKELAKKYGVIKLIKYRGLIGGVRVQQALHAKTEWVVFIDSDVFIYPNWWKIVEPYTMQKNVSWIQTLAKAKYSEPYNSFFEWSIQNIAAVAFYATAVKRSAVINFRRKLEKIHGCEDLALYENIKENKGELVSIKKTLAVHEGDRDELLKNRFIRAGQSYRVWKGYPQALWRSVRTAFTNIGKVLIYALNQKITFNDLIFLLILQIKNWINFSKGVISSGLIRELHTTS